MSSLRIIGGRYGGRKINAPRSSVTHPMGERIRSALFNILGEKVNRAVVLDAFAGSGSVGIEALSRGAAAVTFIEADREAVMVLRKNVAALDIKNSIDVKYTTIDTWIDGDSSEGYDLIFADPPYDNPQFSTVLRLQGLLKPNGLMVLSHIGKGEVPIQTGIVVVDNRSYGTAHLTFFRRDT